MGEDNKLSLEEAKDYVLNYLKIEDFETKVKEDGLAALNELIITTQQTYPYQNIDLLATPAHLRRVPTYYDKKKAYFSGKGGICMTLNPFTSQVLIQFGYNSYLTTATLPERQNPDSHVVIIVRDLTKHGDVHLVDVGGSYPCFQAICLTKEPKIYKNSFIQYTIVKMDEERYGRYHLKGDPREVVLRNGERILPNTKRLFYHFALEPKSDEFLQILMHDTFTNAEESPHLRNILCSFYQPVKGITLRGNLLRVFDENTGTMTAKTLQIFEDYWDALHNDLKVPGVEEEELRKAVKLNFEINPVKL